jgi:hypothetical protein
MAMLAWLMRGGWVMQLCTFAYVVVWPEIIYEVEHALEAEDIARSERTQNMGREPGSVESDDAAIAVATPTSGVAALGDAAVAGFASGFLTLTYDPADPASSITTSLRDLSLSHSQSSIIPANSSNASTPTTSPITTRHNPNPHQPHSHSPSPPPPPPSPTHSHRLNSPSRSPNRNADTEPTPAERAAEKARLARIADKAARALAERATAHARKAPPQRTAHPSVNTARHLQSMSPHVILDAKKATGKESLFLSAIAARLRGRVGGGGGGEGQGQGLGDKRDKGAEGMGMGKGGGAGGTAPAAGAAARLAVPPSRGTGAGTGAAAASGGIKDTGDWDERVANAWPVFCKYFNGRSALERIALQEDMKRKDVWNLLTAMSEYMLCVRHW